ncbi:MAG: hypothetical protein JWP34_5225 [Massilia sp.]|jgi:hypothetical protein|nr:hypothetical protein [Phycisphaerales bacterium]MDB5300956.1 hypothetical protein [Phycisphaerales bacterium]MDB5304785.1 hypothetical protein [Phycisphaerales bacterium]MDB5911108.1 hypothetical protein [Massilia sp.]
MNDGKDNSPREALETRLENYRKSLQLCRVSERLLFEALIRDLERQLGEPDPKQSRKAPSVRAAKIPPPS